MKLILQLVLMLCLAQASGAQEKWGLQRCVEHAVANNISVKQAAVQSRLAQLQLSLDRQSRFPDANFQTSAGYNFGLSDNPTTGTLESRNFFSTQLGLSTSVTIFNWFSRRHLIESSAASAKAEEAQLRKAGDDVALNVAVAYLQALLAKQQVAVSRIGVEQTAIQLDITRKRVAAGALPELNAVQLEAQLALDSANLVGAEGAVRQQLLQLQALLNLPASTPFDIETPPVESIPVEGLADLQPEAVYQLALANLPLRRVNSLRLEAAQKMVASARASMYPTVAAFGGLNSRFVNLQSVQGGILVPRKNTGALVNVNGLDYNVVAPGLDNVVLGITPLFNQFRNNFGQSVGISLTVPIHNGGALRGNWYRAQLQVQQLQLQQQNDNLSLQQDIYRAYNDAFTSLQRFTASRKAVEAAEKAYGFAQKRYNVNLLPTFELISTQNSLLRTREEALNAQFDYVFKMKLLEFYKGQGLKL